MSELKVYIEELRKEISNKDSVINSLAIGLLRNENSTGGAAVEVTWRGTLLCKQRHCSSVTER